MDGPLISVEALAAAIAGGDPHVRTVDCRWVLGQPGAGRRAYDAGHLPGAVFLDVDGDLAADPAVGPGRHPLPDVGAFVRRLEAAGTTISSWPTTTSVAGSPRACGGCSRTSGTSGSSCSMAASMPGRRPATP
jgi:hypothetical protein